MAIDINEELQSKKDVLVTGACGFFGPFLVHELLQAFPNSNVICIVRAKDDDHALQRFSVASKSLQCNSDMQRVKVLAGDVSHPWLGLQYAVYLSLTQSIFYVVHNAARVHGILPYAALRNDNVLGTLNTLRFAVTSRPKEFHLISSVNVLKSAEEHPEAPLSFDMDTPGILSSLAGYPSSKYVSELLVSSAHALAGSLIRRVAIYRPATISAHSETGCCNVSCFFTRVVCGLIQLGGYPSSPHTIPDSLLLTPVDYVSKGIAFLVSNPPKSSNIEVYHFVTDNPVSWDMISSYITHSGYNFNAFSAKKWREALEKMPEENPLAIFRDLLVSGKGFVEQEWCFGPDTSNTKLSLSNSVTCPKFSFETFRKQLNFLHANNIIPLAPALPSPKCTPGDVLNDNYYRIEIWYKDLACYTFATHFLQLQASEVKFLLHLYQKLQVSLLKEDKNFINSRDRKLPSSYVVQVSQEGISSKGGHLFPSFTLIFFPRERTGI